MSEIQWKIGQNLIQISDLTFVASEFKILFLQCSLLGNNFWISRSSFANFIFKLTRKLHFSYTPCRVVVNGEKW